MGKNINICLLSIVITICFTGCNHQSDNNLKLWYENPATKWEEALPIGNGRLGAMIYGTTPDEQIQFNEETLWAGEPHDYSHEGAYNYLGKIRNLLLKGKQKEAEDLALKEFMSLPLRQQKYQPFGDLRIHFPGHENVSDYYRELNLSDATCLTKYTVDNTTYTREYFASFPANLIIVRLSADRKKSLSFDVSLTSVHEENSLRAIGDDAIELYVKVKDGVLFGKAIAKVFAKGGTVNVKDNRITVDKADEVMLCLSAGTNFRSPKDVSGNPGEICAKYLSPITNKSYSTLKSDHIADYQKYFNRFSINLGTSGKENLPTDQRINAILDHMDNSLAALYVQYGRYLLLSSSRKGTYPANLQGIWNDKLNPSWDSKYTVNINTEMNYWPAEVLNVAECHEALFKMLDEVVISGRKVARDHYNARGWVLHHNTDLWRGAAPINASNHGIWPTGSGWLTLHFWEHYLFGNDKKFLEERAWPVMKEAAMFYVDYLVKDPKTGWLISSPSNSPENGGLVAGPTMDHSIIKSLFKACIEASEIIDKDREFADTLQQLLPQIAPYQIGHFGQLQEWMEDKDNPKNKHRHVSHLWGVYPGKEINYADNPALMEAAKTSLIARGDEGTGWSLAWKINLWARFLDGNHAWNMVQMLLRPQGKKVTKATGGGSTGGGSYPNLFDAHPPFQIDGNFGGASGIVEMFIQSHNGGIDILPALPDSVPNGEIRGIRARGGFELDFAWENSEIKYITVKATSDNDLNIRYNGNSFYTRMLKGDMLTFDKNLKEKN